MINFLVNAFDMFANLMVILIFIRVIMSWFQVKNRFAEVIFELTEPVLVPVRKVLPKTVLLDFSPIVTFLLLQVLQYLIHFLTKIPPY